MPASPQLNVLPGREGLQEFTKHPQQGGRSPPNGSFLRPPSSLPEPSGTWAAPPRPPFRPGRAAGREGVVEAKRCGEAGSAPIWRAAVAGKQGAEGTETCVTSFSLLSLLPSPPGPACRLKGHRDPDSRWGLPPAGRIGPGGFLSSRTPPYAQHLLTARPATAPLSAGAGANPIYRPGQARPARMRRRLTPPDCALPSPARPPRRPSVRVHLFSTSPACAARRREGVSRRLLPPPRSGSPPLCFRISRPCFPVPSRPQLPDPVRVRPRLSPGLRPGGGGTGEHKSSQEVAILRRTVAVPPRSQGTQFLRKRRRDQEGPPPREERRFGWRAGQWEARTAAQRGEAAECKQSRARRGPRVSPRATRRVWDHRGRPWHLRAAILWDACLALFSSPLTEVRVNHFPLPAPPTGLPPMGGNTKSLASGDIESKEAPNLQSQEARYHYNAYDGALVPGGVASVCSHLKTLGGVKA
ncbi:translation initiation factor IF-2-like [Zalophus californianus]|uniref:Translation initiation factor IF-2-like n=1 Tax=Zalophus californianus TaxID=9704 RepID=A0A6J2DM88_ZALCA|nr:translation initiation factor IF-2-like [Zalophus californianus]